ncbi:MAG: DUF6430 domain-containing protein [Candidatus Thiodiazotropha taylori]|nr:DUF6430 domain-containing protein [Candidatus Thiodiazotropha taylori]
MKYFIDTITSAAYWKYVLLSRTGIQSALAVFGSIYLIIGALDFFNLYTKDKYSSWAFPAITALSVLISVTTRRPISSTTIRLPNIDSCVEVRIGDIFDSEGAVMISANTEFESDVAGGKIAPTSLQGQFTGRYFTGNQSELINTIHEQFGDRSPPFPMGTTFPVTTHGKTFYFTAMSQLNDKGNASSSPDDLQLALNGLWDYVRSKGELQKLAVPLLGTGRGRVILTRRKIITLIVESFYEQSKIGPITDHLIISIRPEDASKFKVNLYDVKDHLRHTLYG